MEYSRLRCMMKILANRKIKFLFCSILSCILVFVLISTVLVNLDVRNTVYYIIFCSVCMGAAILLFCYGYFKEQHKIMENAISQITEYISGNKEVKNTSKSNLQKIFLPPTRSGRAGRRVRCRPMSVS